MKWVTRKNIKVDRVACPWLIRRFIDADAEFLFVEEAQLGLRAIADGCQAMGLSDEDRLAKQFPMYNALFAYCRKQIK